ncbi:MAG TPA: DUF4349 domain-containing protein [Bacteroidales bacterium]|nr:DUF4349 domain-containing protein [Bacteroidales bacterium]HRZ49165.1 DUF4349 domain-containing protein [Bacteroidales bacterium]
MKTYLVLIAATLMLVSCGSKNNDPSTLMNDMFLSEYDASTEEAAVEEPVLEDPILEEPVNIEEAIERKIIKDGRLEVEVGDLAEEKRKLDTLVAKMGAWYSNEQLFNESRQTTIGLIIRIPADRFEPFIAAIEQGGGKIIAKSIEARDVTEEYIDLETRLANKRNYMLRYQELLKSARNVKDILEIQENIRQLQEEIESTQGRLQYLSKQVSYSTLTLSISQPKPYSYSPDERAKPSEKIRQSLFGGWYAFVDFVYILLYNWVLILLVLAAATLWLIRRRRNRHRKAKA